MILTLHDIYLNKTQKRAKKATFLKSFLYWKNIKICFFSLFFPQYYTWEPRGKKKLEEFWFFLEMWKWVPRKFILEGYITISRRPRLEIISSRFGFLEVCFCSSSTQNLEILIRDFPRDTTLEELITRGEILLLEKV